ncbi:hypothetical protein GQX74_004689 [Glossina fuscipes]|nr:hypothetical protein GQX74_004689 [Glossina fuscipes]
MANFGTEGNKKIENITNTTTTTTSTTTTPTTINTTTTTTINTTTTTTTTTKITTRTTTISRTKTTTSLAKITRNSVIDNNDDDIITVLPISSISTTTTTTTTTTATTTITTASAVGAASFIGSSAIITPTSKSTISSSSYTATSFSQHTVVGINQPNTTHSADIQQQELRLRKLRELAPKKKNGNRRFRSWRERVRFYSTSTLAFFSVTAGASLLFLVPLYVDPAISTLSHDFIEQPTLCTTTRRENLIGIFNCSWSSCREGCTSDLYRCVHIYVTFIEQNITIPENMTDFTNYTAEWEQSDEATLLVNIKGCGYPPTVTCSKFNAFYGLPGAIFPCYYSRKNKTVVMTSYNHDDQVNMIIHFFAIPFVITMISSIALCVMHCDCRCKKDRSHRRNRPQSRRPRIDNLR